MSFLLLVPSELEEDGGGEGGFSGGRSGLAGACGGYVWAARARDGWGHHVVWRA